MASVSTSRRAREAQTLMRAEEVMLIIAAAHLLYSTVARMLDLVTRVKFQTLPLTSYSFFLIWRMGITVSNNKLKYVQLSST